MDRHETLTVTQSVPGARLDAWLHAQFPQVSRNAFQRLMDEGHVRVNARPAKPAQTPRLGDQIEICFPAARPAVAQPQAMPLEILHEDDALLVLNKPVGLVVHPASGHETHTLVNALLHHCAGQLSGVGGVARPGIVHRLDKDTSGVMVVAKHDAAHHGLTEQFQAREIKKLYHALLCGVLPHDAGDIRAPIARHVTHRKRMAVTDDDARGRDAWTSYRVLERLPAATYAEAGLHTGRTHQIRVHFKHLGHPIVGDEVYGDRANARLRQPAGWQAPRQMLHAHTLGFTHPVTGKKLEFTAPLPADFQAALEHLRGGAGK